jgi:F-type H+-transporting ATPase subunit epsilon
MRLKVLLPSEILVDQEVAKVIAEGQNGEFCLLSRHIDFLAALVPGIFLYTTPDGREQFLAVDQGTLVKCLAVDQGTLVKCGPEVLVSTRNAVLGPDLGALEQMVAENFQAVEEREAAARLAFSKLEVGFIRRFMELESRG